MSETPKREGRSLVVRDGLVTVKELAEYLGVDRSHVFKVLKKWSIPMEKRRSPEAMGQFVSVISRQDAERVIESRAKETLGSGGQVAYIG